MGFVISALLFAFVVFSVVDVVRRPDSEIRYLPKFAWVIIVLLFSPIGGALWWALGREYSRPLRVEMPRRRPRSTPADPPAAPHPAPMPGAPRSTEQQIADLDREIEEWRLREEIAKRRKTDEEPPNPLGE